MPWIVSSLNNSLKYSAYQIMPILAMDSLLALVLIFYKNARCLINCLRTLRWITLILVSCLVMPLANKFNYCVGILFLVRYYIYLLGYSYAYLCMYSSVL